MIHDVCVRARALYYLYILYILFKTVENNINISILWESSGQ